MHWMIAGLLLSLGDAAPVPVQETWPQWRGPMGNSIAPAGRLPLRWNRGSNVVWATELPGWGNSTPAIWGKAVFLTSQQNEKLLALRLDRDTGQIVWQQQLGQGIPRRDGPVGNGRYNNEHNMASPSPVTDGQHVWFHFGNGVLACLDFDGKPVWTMNLAERFGAYTIWWGHSNSPLLVDDLLISVCMQDPKGGGKSYVLAQDKNTGDVKWNVRRESSARDEPADAYTTPLVYRHDGKTEIIVLGANILDAYDAKSGKQLWQCGIFSGNRTITGPTLAGDTVYAVQGMRGPLFAIRAGGMGDVQTSHFRWKYSGSTPDSPSPTVAYGLLFMVSDDGWATCLDAATGQQEWKQRLGGTRYKSTPLAANGKIYFQSQQGQTTIVEASRTFKVLERNSLDEETIASPAVAGGRLFLRTKQNLYCIGDGR
jgi:outer membrane protein assembly factor BamB